MGYATVRSYTYDGTYMPSSRWERRNWIGWKTSTKVYPVSHLPTIAASALELIGISKLS